MTKIADVTCFGASGASYRFEVFTHESNFNDISAFYVFTKRTLIGSKGEHEKIYIGESSELGKRIASHEKWSCAKKHGCNCICVHAVAGDKRRLDIENDLRSGNGTPCNEQ